MSEILLTGNYISAEDLQKATEETKDSGGSLADYLLSHGLLTRKLLGQAMAEYYHVPFADLEIKPPGHDQVMKIPVSTALRYGILLFEEDDKSVTLATDKPTREGMLPEMENLFRGKAIRIAYAPKEQIDSFLKAYEEPLVMKIIEAIGGGGKVAPEIIKQIFEDALTRHTSDIHFEPQEEEVLVRFRIDGVLHVVGKLPKETYENILTRIKIQAHLRIDEHYAAQDGAIRFKIEGASKPVDMRISIVPTLDGETVAVRILSGYIQSMGLSDLGLSEDHQAVINTASKRPFGMILATGPTGSGKTTTLYAIVKTLNLPDVNITTIEDPVEYKIPRVNQIQVNSQTDLTFARGLRSIVRQDPNIILVGEVRDLETAEIAVNAALTGHLLLSSFHANDAATTIPRLLNMGVEPFMLASTLELIVAQRLVRKICESCRYSYVLKEGEIKTHWLGLGAYLKKGINLYRGKGCAACNHTGFKGRTAIFEMISMTTAMRDLILTNPSVQRIEALARKEGIKVMFEDGIEKVKNGVTTIEELMRVAALPIKKEDK